MASTNLSDPYVGLVGSKNRSLRPLYFVRLQSTRPPDLRQMDLGIAAALVMLGVWALATFTTEAPGWIHGLLTLGVFLLIYRMVVRGKVK